MFYRFLRGLVAFLLFIFNGKAKYYNLDRIPDPSENYVLVAPHRIILDPVYLAFATKPKQFIFMAKKELFKNRLFAWWIRKCGAFPIDRENPGREVIQYPVKMLKKSDKSLIMFPSGSRHSSEMKGGVTLIAKMAKVRIVPAVYQGPLSMKGIFKREQVHINFGEPIDISDVAKANDEGIQEVNRRMEEAFAQLDKEINPDFKYIAK
ncbi:MAG: 1-acyl-sn-glycerol-3-phosphate acyltransferase [Streptococcaceae bacterium]|nr:1-acyl-sn-glycerol-3-phosphate acyltransferase [Streptococcaceae bacterium]MCL2681255.1 1-acyl-sn-glycerol-3-phosphate acyltransferase [Streptococcaceae bacterium]MCL2858180.1 1-acyl-sn-glycerol-3-phosphate acyltransferase [Streptococcaceae bacterium]